MKQRLFLTRTSDLIRSVRLNDCQIVAYVIRPDQEIAGTRIAKRNSVSCRSSLVFAVAALAALAAPARAQSGSNCTFCHSEAGSLPAIHRTAEWEASGHAAPSVGCQSCHGGNPAATNLADAHRGVLHSTSPLSTVNEVNLPSTCVSCHRTTAMAVSGTIHQILAEAGDGRTPTCVTCHGIALSQVPTPAEMERQCATCHRPGSPRASYPAAARQVLDAIASLRSSAAALGTEIATMNDTPRRTEQMARLLDTQAMLKEASASFHQFRPAAMTATLDTIRQRLADLADAHAASIR